MCFLYVEREVWKSPGIVNPSPSPSALADCLFTLGAVLVPWEPALPAWEAALFTSDPVLAPWGSALTAWGLQLPITCLGSIYWLPACLPGNCYLPWGACWLFGRSAGMPGDQWCLPGSHLPGGTVLFPWELALNTWELTAWEAWEALIAWESVLSACELPAWGNSAISKCVIHIPPPKPGGGVQYWGLFAQSTPCIG